MAVDYREVNQFLRVSASQLPYQDLIFQQLAGQVYYAKVNNIWEYQSTEIGSSKHQASLYHVTGVCRVLSFPLCNFYCAG